MKWHYIQHVEFEGPAYVEAWAEGRGHVLEGTRLWGGEEFPSLETFDGLFILGGPMNVYEEDLYPWLVSERCFISEVISAGKPVLGSSWRQCYRQLLQGNRVVSSGTDSRSTKRHTV